MSLLKRVMTPAQVAASRANGKKSKGPKTPQGKARVSLNALKTGAYAKTDKARREMMLRRGENPDDFEPLQQIDNREPEKGNRDWGIGNSEKGALPHAGPASSPRSAVATEQPVADEPTDRSGGASFAQSAENLFENRSIEHETAVDGEVAAKNEKNGSIEPDKSSIINNIIPKTNLEQTL